MAREAPLVEEYEDGEAQLTLHGAIGPTRAAFEELGWTGNGYDWGAIAQALALMKMPTWARQLFFDPEGDYLLVIGPSKAVMEELATWLLGTMDHSHLLQTALRFAEEHDLEGTSDEAWEKALQIHAREE